MLFFIIWSFVKITAAMFARKWAWASFLINVWNINRGMQTFVNQTHNKPNYKPQKGGLFVQKRVLMAQRYAIKVVNWVSDASA